MSVARTNGMLRSSPGAGDDRDGRHARGRGDRLALRRLRREDVHERLGVRRETDANGRLVAAARQLLPQHLGERRRTLDGDGALALGGGLEPRAGARRS